MPPGRALGTFGLSKSQNSVSVSLNGHHRSLSCCVFASGAGLYRAGEWRNALDDFVSPRLADACGMEAPGKAYQLRYGRSRLGDDDVSSSPS